MKVSELAYERVVTCDLCGRDFVVTQKFSHAKRCPECKISIRNGEKREGFRHQSIIGKRKKRVSKLDTLAMEAKQYGLSYGQYTALRAAGYTIRPRQTGTYINLAMQEWLATLYEIVAAGRRRAENRGA